MEEAGYQCALCASPAVIFVVPKYGNMDETRVDVLCTVHLEVLVNSIKDAIDAI